MSLYDVKIPVIDRVDGEPGTLCFRIPKGYASPVERLLGQVEGRNCHQYRLEVGPVRRQRTSGPRSQNSRIHGHLSVIAQETGNDLEDLKLYVCSRAMRRGYPPRRDDQGHVLYSLMTGDPLPEHTSKATVEEASLVIEEIHQLAAELEIQLPEYEEQGEPVYV